MGKHPCMHSKALTTHTRKRARGHTCEHAHAPEASKSLPVLESTKKVEPDDDFDATPDGAYSLDRREVKVDDTDLRASLVVEMSLVRA